MSQSRKTVLITGCSAGGLGSSLAEAFHAANYRVLATARNPAKMAHLTHLGIETLPLDVQDEASIAACVTQVSTLTDGRLDMLVNNAGGGYTAPLLDASLPRGKAVFELNVWSLLLMAQAFTPLLIAAKGRLVNNTSVNSVMNVPYSGVYNAAKAAAAMLTSNLRIELAPLGVRVVDLRTGVVRSNFQHNRPEEEDSIPPESVYSVARGEVEAVLAKTRKTEGYEMPAEKWAKSVVEALREERAPAQVWRGTYAMGCWVLGNFMPSWLLDSFLTKESGLEDVKRKMLEVK